MTNSTTRRVLTATAIAGTLDILAAIVLTLIYGRKIDAMLRYVASGPFPDAKHWGTAGAALGLAVHFALMAIMAALYIVAADRMARLKSQPLLWGVIYGALTWIAMNWVVVPLRFGTTPSLVGAATQLFCHIVLVGIPIAYAARR
ncbi:hypothetical protein [Sphingomonas sp.]|uniref:hypothetical protein n=1 Tax=Sphingomonas sp. TaxID=28214 RepID=UPI001EB43FF3|nr:hypothetical protein [Sphingomonas sp.]MBX3595497.1 hypothetical protein [Sphingomonas sp.]